MSWTRIGAVLSLEFRTQRREPLTVLYVLVFSLLAMAFAAAGPVDLVGDRGMIPRDAPWSLMLASTALTAFGQVITTMVAATVVLRDRADRVADLMATTPLSPREYLLGKLLAALLLLSLIYCAVPLGLIAGSVVGGGSFASAVVGSLLPFLAVVVPTMLAIGALQFAVGVLSGRLWVIVGQGLVLIWLWTAVADASRAAGGQGWVTLLDPFGSAALLFETRDWSDAARRVGRMPLTPLVFAGRMLWLVLGGLAATVAVMWTPRGVAHRPRLAAARRALAPIPLPTSSPAPTPARPARVPRDHWWPGAVGTASYVARWMLRDTGWRVLTLLGALNVLVHAFLDASRLHDPLLVTQAALSALQLHARLFLILLATIYAGELVWREREERSAPLVDPLPISENALCAGRVAGVLVAQCALVSVLVVAAAVGAMVAAGAPVRGGVLLRGVLGGVLLPFVLWMLLSLAVHLLVQQKVAAHLVCIAGWVLGALRYGAALPSTVAVGHVAIEGLAIVGSLVVIRWAWGARGAGRSWHHRPRELSTSGSLK